MRARGNDPARRALRLVLCVVEIGVAGILMLLAIAFCIIDTGRVGGDGIASVLGRMVAVPLVLCGVGLALAGIKAAAAG